MAFRFNRAGTTAMGKPSAAYAAETEKVIKTLIPIVVVELLFKICECYILLNTILEHTHTVDYCWCKFRCTTMKSYLTQQLVSHLYQLFCKEELERQERNSDLCLCHRRVFQNLFLQLELAILP